jgi:hypothetical protein
MDATGDGFAAEERRWLAWWDARVSDVASGAMRAEDVCDWVWKKKVLNAINVTIQRIKRAERPGLDPRRNDNTWVTVAAERGRSAEDVSPLARQTLDCIAGKLDARGHVFDVDWMPRSSGVVVISINVKALREFMQRRQAGSTPAV